MDEIPGLTPYDKYNYLVAERKGSPSDKGYKRLKQQREWHKKGIVIPENPLPELVYDPTGGEQWKKTQSSGSTLGEETTSGGGGSVPPPNNGGNGGSVPPSDSGNENEGPSWSEPIQDARVVGSSLGWFRNGVQDAMQNWPSGTVGLYMSLVALLLILWILLAKIKIGDAIGMTRWQLGGKVLSGEASL